MKYTLVIFIMLLSGCGGQEQAAAPAFASEKALVRPPTSTNAPTSSLPEAPAEAKRRQYLSRASEKPHGKQN
jgi:hypothetical protein